MYTAGDLIRALETLDPETPVIEEILEEPYSFFSSCKITRVAIRLSVGLQDKEHEKFTEELFFQRDPED